MLLQFLRGPQMSRISCGSSGPFGQAAGLWRTKITLEHDDVSANGNEMFLFRRSLGIRGLTMQRFPRTASDQKSTVPSILRFQPRPWDDGALE